MESFSAKPLTLTKEQARWFMLDHHRLWPPRSLSGKESILSILRHLGCIQYDPVNIVGRNPDLMLQSRISGYQPEWLHTLMYTDRRIVDGWDKVASIYLAEDWPYFSRYRQHMLKNYGNHDNPLMKVKDAVLKSIEQHGPLSSLELEHDEVVRGWWGENTRLARACLEVLYGMGIIGIHHRVNSRRYFDLIERLVPPQFVNTPDPNPEEETYQEWHGLRRIGSMGLADPGSIESWLGIVGGKSPVRKAALQRLVARGLVAQVQITGLEDKVFYARSQDLSRLDVIEAMDHVEPRAAILCPLDNLLWQRNTLRGIFDFDYIWEVYKPADQVKYGRYTLPVLFGDRFIARFEPALNRKAKTLTLVDWWWEEGIKVNREMQAALIDCLQQFGRFLGVGEIIASETAQEKKSMGWLKNLA